MLQSQQQFPGRAAIVCGAEESANPGTLAKPEIPRSSQQVLAQQTVGHAAAAAAAPHAVAIAALQHYSIAALSAHRTAITTQQRLLFSALERFTRSQTGRQCRGQCRRQYSKQPSPVSLGRIWQNLAGTAASNHQHVGVKSSKCRFRIYSFDISL